MPPPSTDILERNLARLRLTEPELANRLAAESPAPLTWADTPKGQPTALVEHQGRKLQLASRFDPLDEARQINRDVDFSKHGAVVILGLGLGYHVDLLAKAAGENTLLMVYEPDRAVLRAVLEKIDHTAWLGQPNVVLIDDTIDRAALIERIEPFGGILTQGTFLLHHPPTRIRWAQKTQAFCNLVTEALGYCRLHVATMLVNSGRTIENLTGNLAWYAAGANTNELLNAAAGYPAVCVSAGPSLARNVDLLRDPNFRRNVVVITAQTTLKVLLARGIQPDLVTALDYHEISRRFYEGLPQLPGVTLVAEAKAHPSVIEQYPGPVRVCASGFLNRLLGPKAPNIASVKQGATVAHLSLYLAQHMGCNPIILIGQDLGFSNGLYYCPGTAIHETWACELSPFNTLEMFEWQRIVRHRGHLEKRSDIRGQPIYTDEQMITYLNQFERDFAAATQTILDATEGGLPKAHSTPITLREALEKHATRPVPPLPLPQGRFDPARLCSALELMRQRLTETRELQKLTDDTIPVLHQMLKHQHDYDMATRLFERVEKNRQRVAQLQDTFALVNDLNAIGAFKRARADRAIQHNDSTDAFAQQRRQIERDLENLRWLSQAIKESLTIFTRSLQRLETIAANNTPKK